MPDLTASYRERTAGDIQQSLNIAGSERRSPVILGKQGRRSPARHAHDHITLRKIPIRFAGKRRWQPEILNPGTAA